MRTEFAKVRTGIAVAKHGKIRWMVVLFLAQISVTVGVLIRLVG